MSAIADLVAVATGDREKFMAMAEEHFRELNSRFTPAQDWKASYFENILGNRNYSLRWVVADGLRVGFVLYGVEEHRFLSRKTGVIYELYIVPDQRRKGIARACAESVIQELWRAFPSKIQLEVVEGNRAAAELWRSLGFQKVSERLILATDQRVKR